MGKQFELRIITESSRQTQQVGELFSKEIARGSFSGKEKKKGALIIGLEGELGSGKTAFVQGIAKGFGIKARISSPTFVILKRYSVKKVARLYHIDCYRLKRPKDLLDLGFKEIINNPQNVVIIEWAERIKRILPPNILWINFEHFNQKSQNKRKIIVKSLG